VISLTAFDRTTAAPPAHSTDEGALVWLIFLVVVVSIVAIMGLVAMLLEWELVAAVRTTSRSLVLFTFLLGAAAVSVVLRSPVGGAHRGLPRGGRAGDLSGVSIATAGAWPVGLARGQRGAGPGYYPLVGMAAPRPLC
jgi:hypothetical protein